MNETTSDAWDPLLNEYRRSGGKLSPKAYFRLMHAAQTLANNGIELELGRVKLPPELLKYVLEIADGTRQRPAEKPPKPPIDKFRNWNASRLRLAARDVDRYKEVWGKRYGRRKVHEEALERAAAHWQLDPDKLKDFYHRAKSGS